MLGERFALHWRVRNTPSVHQQGLSRPKSKQSRKRGDAGDNSVHHGLDSSSEVHETRRGKLRAAHNSEALDA